jgi:hypothetical protein
MKMLKIRENNIDFPLIRPAQLSIRFVANFSQAPSTTFKPKDRQATFSHGKKGRRGNKSTFALSSPPKLVSMRLHEDDGHNPASTIL